MNKAGAVLAILFIIIMIAVIAWNWNENNKDMKAIETLTREQYGVTEEEQRAFEEDFYSRHPELK